MLVYANWDEPFILQTDASEVAIAAVVGQYDKNGALRPLIFHSRVLSKDEAKLHISYKELLAGVYGVMKGNYYLYGRPFQWETDSTALVCFANLHSRDIAGPRGRLLQRLEQYQYDIKYIPRKRNLLADLGTNIPRHLTDAELIEELKQWPVMEDCMTVGNRLRAALELAKTGIPKCLLTRPDGNIEEDEEVDSIQSGSGNLPAFTERQLSEFNVEHQPV
eukprot:Nk52_evm1s842 gene=Nk52_evmTU1s842